MVYIRAETCAVVRRLCEQQHAQSHHALCINRGETAKKELEQEGRR